MSIIHKTTLVPTKLELLAGWLPAQPWYGGSGAPELTRAGGFRLDDPAGAVGIELMIVLDEGGASYLAPMTYRAAPLDGADAALIGTTEHGVLGTRYVYDAPHDPVFRGQLLALVQGRAEPQAQSDNDAPDPTVLFTPVPGATAAEVVRVLAKAEGAPVPGEVSVPFRLTDPRTRAVVVRAI